MTPPPDPKTPGFFERLSPRAQWAVLIACSCLLAAVLEIAGLPAALLLGPMIAGILVGSNGGRIRAPRLPVLAAQTIVGCLVARAITGDIVLAFLKDWPLFLGVVLVIIATSARTRLDHGPIQGVAGNNRGVGHGTGCGLGHDGDGRRVRRRCAARRIHAVSARRDRGGLGLGRRAAMGRRFRRPWCPHIVWFPAVAWQDFMATLAVAGVCGAIGVGLRIPAGALLLPMIVGAVLEAMGLVTIILPPWLLALSYAFLGWSIGLGFTREILGARLARAAPGSARDLRHDRRMRRCSRFCWSTPPASIR